MHAHMHAHMYAHGHSQQNDWQAHGVLRSHGKKMKALFKSCVTMEEVSGFFVAQLPHLKSEGDSGISS